MKFLRRHLPMSLRLWVWHRHHAGYRGECSLAEYYETSPDSDWGDPVDVVPVPKAVTSTVLVATGTPLTINSWHANGGRVVLTQTIGAVASNQGGPS